MSKQTPHQLRNLLILREYLKGTTFVVIADGLGLSHSRPKQIVSKYLRILRAFVSKEGEQIDRELDHERWMNPKLHASYWQGVQARYEAKEAVCTINDEVPVPKKPVVCSPEEILQAEEEKLAKRIGWLRRRLAGESFKAIALADGVTYPVVYRGAMIVLEQLPYRLGQFNDPLWYLNTYPVTISLLLDKFEKQSFPNTSPKETA